MNRILVTGSQGQLGSDLVTTLRQIYGVEQVVESGRSPPHSENNFYLYKTLDVTNHQQLQTIIEQEQIQTIYHLAGVLSAKGEQYPDRCWDVNVNGLRNILEAAKTYQLKVFFPSSIAVFGPHTPKLDTPQITVEDPATIYGITKVTGELLCHYYAHRFGVDVRSLRLPGIISYSTPPGGGTTDFAVAIFAAALQHGTYTCFVRPETRLPMMYVPDAIRAILDLMAADPNSIKIRSSYNITAVSFSAAELVTEIQKHLPHFNCHYAPDFRQAIADSWPAVIDDSRARADWGWKHQYDLSAIVVDMLEKLSQRIEVTSQKPAVRS
ncbi:NAD-dependent epimerase/dehydratase family protein [Trichocoleus sp. FACHB-262]|uniref:NAD-dependent epimerase/dehydratase family protein n=1 Tax=Trichocoleus sp. FACHB-262 TaxID=2692869 RepID=UPI001687E423|nr:NAD-dependent epimerase/dehydratase family protein [Trichocoleus sp. FACHB-262]MBD2120700.1 NAD-dependent epimerase/dehydratase family protein [Trichocoleus sp. FACHB-262]